MVSNMVDPLGLDGTNAQEWEKVRQERPGSKSSTYTSARESKNTSANNHAWHRLVHALFCVSRSTKDSKVNPAQCVCEERQENLLVSPSLPSLLYLGAIDPW